MLYLIITALCVAADQLTKYLAVEHLKGACAQTVIPGLLGLNYAENTGMAFSLFRGQRWLFVALTLVAVALILYLLFSKKYITSRAGNCLLAVVLAGALGNLIDRVRLGYVVDMIEFLFIDFAIFNVADIFVTVGGTLLCIGYIVYEVRASRHKKEQGDGGDHSG